MSLRPLPYHCNISTYLEDEESGLWNWFRSDEFGTKYADAIRLELLKSTYRLDRATHMDLHLAADAVAEALELSAPITIYQAEGGTMMNAALCFIPGEIHVALQGPVLRSLSDAELRVLLGHEFSHYKLWSEEDGRFFTTDRLLAAIATDPAGKPSHVESIIRHRLYTEIYADRGGFLATGDVDAVIRCLVKVATGLAHVDAKAYLEQAGEILKAEAKATEETSHPESFLRARAIQLFNDNPKDMDSKIAELVQGALRFDCMDLLDQRDLQSTTRRVLDAMLATTAFTSEAQLGHAKCFFADYKRSSHKTSDEVDEQLTNAIARLDKPAKEYLAYLMLDFALIDPDLDEVGACHAILVSEELGLRDAFSQVYRKEVKATKAKFEALAARAGDVVGRAIDAQEIQLGKEKA